MRSLRSDSRSAKSLRRLFLDEIFGDLHSAATPEHRSASRRGAALRRSSLSNGDDSVAQLGGVHLACEGVSNILTKIIEWGRLMAYLEQSTRYVPYRTDPAGLGSITCRRRSKARLHARYKATLDRMFETYTRWIEPMQDHFRQRFPKDPGDTDGVYRAAIRAKALDTLRGLLPAAVQSNVGLFGTGQAYEALLLRMRANPLVEAQEYAGLILTELRKVIPAFLTRVDQPERGARWTQYLVDTRKATDQVASRLLSDADPVAMPEVALTDFDPDGEIKVVAAALYASSELPDEQLLAMARRMRWPTALACCAPIGARAHRRHKPGVFERTAHLFHLADYGSRLAAASPADRVAPLGAPHGPQPDAIETAGAHAD